MRYVRRDTQEAARRLHSSISQVYQIIRVILKLCRKLFYIIHPFIYLVISFIPGSRFSSVARVRKLALFIFPGNEVARRSKNETRAPARHNTKHIAVR